VYGDDEGPDCAAEVAGVDEDALDCAGGGGDDAVVREVVGDQCPAEGLDEVCRQNRDK